MTNETNTTAPQNIQNQMIDTAALAALWSVSLVNLVNSRSLGKSLIPFYKIGRSVRYKLSEAVAFIENQRA